jgi:serine/threonine-protein kinase
MPRLGGIPSGTYDKNEGRFFFYSEEYLPGPTLHELIAKGVFDADALVKLAGDITTALDALWTQTNQVHRDVKPRNIIRRDDTGDYALIDAGIALALEETSLTPSGLVMGTLRYCSPEQIQGRKRALDIRSDFYALGIVLFEAATGHHPYCAARQSDPEIVQHILRTRPPALESIRADLPPELSKLVDCLLAKQSYLRPKTGADLLLTLRALGYS